VLVIKNLSLYFSKDLRMLLDDFNFSLQEGMKVALIGEEGNGKSTLLKVITDPKLVQSYMEIKGQISKSGEIIGYLPQIIGGDVLGQTTDHYFQQKVDWAQFDYNQYYDLMRQMGFLENRISQDITVRQLSGGEKIKFLLLCEMLQRPTILLLDEPSNDLDLESMKWLENFIITSKIPVMFVSHDELLLERCANTIIHLEQLRRKSKPQYTIASLPYGEYVKNRAEQILKQTQVAKKEKEEYDAKMERYRQIYQRVQHELQTVSRQAPSVAKNLKDKMHSVKSMGRRFVREKENMTQKPDFEESILVRFGESISIPRGKRILDFHLDTLVAGGHVLSRNLQLTIHGPRKICIMGANGAGKTTLLRQILKELEHNGIAHGYMPQDYTEMMNPELNAVEFLSQTGRVDELTMVRTYLGSMNFTKEEMFRPVGDLSGGQRAKLYFSKMILDQAEVLVLDEPTRNLSPLSGPEIREALQKFTGCIIAVSHDRKFIREVFDEVLFLDQEGLHMVDFELFMSSV
jgi:ATPase subunit of ABC transporter with duplicated ATPase domains